MAQDLELNKNEVVAVVVAYAEAGVGDKVVARFNQNGVNIFSIATANLGGGAGDLIIEAGVGYEFDVPVSKALLLEDSVAGKWEIHLMRDYDYNPANNAAPLLIDSGNITVIPLEASSSEGIPIGYENLSRIRPNPSDETAIDDDTDITQYDDIVVFTPPDLTTITATLLAFNLLIGKKYTFYNNGDGAVEISNGTDVLFTINAKGDSLKIIATTVGWIKV